MSPTMDGRGQTYDLVLGLDEQTAEDVARLYTLVGWGESYSVDEVRQALLDTQSVIRAVTSAGETIGFARIFGDGRYYTCIGELVVHPDWQGRGIGTALLSRACELYGRSPIFLETFRGREGFFERSGFNAKAEMVVMSKRKSEGS